MTSQNRRHFLKLAGMAGVGLAHFGVGRMDAHGQDKEKVTNKVTVGHAVATLDDGSTLATPFWRVESGKDGPSLLALAAQHGNEIHGAEVARRLKDVCARRLVAGSVWLVPMANLPAIRVRRHSVDLGPEQPGRFSKGHNMQQAWPGNPEGNNTERVAYALDQAVVRHCSHGVDIPLLERILGGGNPGGDRARAVETARRSDRHPVHQPWPFPPPARRRRYFPTDACSRRGDRHGTVRPVPDERAAGGDRAEVDGQYRQGGWG